MNAYVFTGCNSTIVGQSLLTIVLHDHTHIHSHTLTNTHAQHTHTHHTQ